MSTVTITLADIDPHGQYSRVKVGIQRARSLPEHVADWTPAELVAHEVLCQISEIMAEPHPPQHDDHNEA